MNKKEIKLPVQLNGKLKGTVLVDTTLPQSKIQDLCLPILNINIEQVKKVIYIPGRIINFIV